ncbi:hypothetical protein D3C76_1756610 [compost metagenome]
MIAVVFFFVRIGIDVLLGIVSGRHVATVLVEHRKEFTQSQWTSNGADNVALCLSQ